MPCLDCGRPGTQMCDRCRIARVNARSRSRGSRTVRGYGWQHQKLRAAWQALINAGEHVVCARAALGECVAADPVIYPDTRWDLGHNDDRTEWTGPEHAGCNRRAGGRTAHRNRGQET